MEGLNRPVVITVLYIVYFKVSLIINGFEYSFADLMVAFEMSVEVSRGIVTVPVFLGACLRPDGQLDLSYLDQLSVINVTVGFIWTVTCGC